MRSAIIRRAHGAVKGRKAEGSKRTGEAVASAGLCDCGFPFLLRFRSSSAFCLSRWPPFFLRRFAALVLVLFCVVTITFFMIRLAPGSPFDRDRKLAPAIERELRLKYQLEGPEGRAAGQALAGETRPRRRRAGPAGRGRVVPPAISSITCATCSTATCGFPPSTATARSTKSSRKRCPSRSRWAAWRS